MDPPASTLPVTAPSITGIRHDISSELLNDLLAVVGTQSGEVVLAAGLVDEEATVLLFIIPVSRTSTYLICTNQRVIIATASSDGSKAIEASIAYGSMHRIDVEWPSGRTTALSNESVSEALSTHVNIRLRDGSMVALDTEAHDFIRCAMQAVSAYVTVRLPKDNP